MARIVGVAGVEGDKEALALVEVSAEELRTIVYALREYKGNVLSTVEGLQNIPNKVSEGLEDELFCYDIAAKCAALEFAIRFDHDVEHFEKVKAFLNF
jgi:hypothetical protein